MCQTRSLVVCLVSLFAILPVTEAFSQNRNPNRQQQARMLERQRREAQRGQSMRGDSGLKVGEAAPTFVLKSLDGKSETNLSDYRHRKPVVLLFGSYT